MKSRIHKTQIRWFRQGVEYTNAKGFYTVLILAVCWILNTKFGFGVERLNRITSDLYEFFAKEDLTTIAEELTYWANKKGIKY